jgi:4-hydroxy-2-oxoglutarate aldolase
MTAEALERHFLEIAEKSSRMLLLYNVPKFTGVEIPIQTVRRVSNHPNILGMKESSGDITYQQSMLAMELENFHILTGTANTLLTSLLMGASGAILALANIAPQFCLDIYQAVRAGNLEEARKLQLKVLRLNQLTTAIHGIGGLKFALDKLGFKGGLPRSPLTEPDEIGKKEILQELKNLNLIESPNSA